ncbi:hypothetical protein KKE26_10430 [bacterium]|nr:hypothetical protein [bacterium]MBU1754378.1 hypothetical protein [bacterium]
MQAVEYYAEILPDGHISLPQDTISELWLSRGKKIKVILLNEWASKLEKESENFNPWDKLEELGLKITKLWKSEKHSRQLISESRR